MEINKTKPNFKEVLQIPENEIKKIEKTALNRPHSGVHFYEGYMYLTDSHFAYKRAFESEEMNGKRITLTGDIEASGMGEALKNVYKEKGEAEKVGSIMINLKLLESIVNIAKLQNINDLTIEMPKEETMPLVIKQGDRTYLLMPKLTK